jgi:hypothetical protein
MRKFLMLLVAALLLLPMLSSTGSAEEKEMAPNILPPTDATSPGDYYQVVFDAEAEASVLAMFTRLSTGTDPIDDIVLEIPGRVNLRYVFQEVPACQSECVRYGQQCAEDEVVCTSWDEPTSTCKAWGKRCKRYDNVCLEYEERCYGWQKTYVPLAYDAEPLSKSVRYTIHLKQPIKQAETGTILVYYKATGYVNPLINYDFDFETAKGPYDVEYARVAVATDSELYLRGAGTKTDYMPGLAQFESYAKETSAGSASAAEYMGTYVSGIRYASGYVKEKRGLDPWESFHVYGSYNYANLWFLTYFWETVAGLAVLILFKLFLWHFVKNALTSAFQGKREEKRKPERKEGKPASDGRFTRVAFAGLVSSLALLVASWAIFSWLLPSGSQFSYYPFSVFFGMLLLIASAAVMLIVFLAPAVWMWRRFGLNEGISTVVAAVIWLFILIGIISLFVQGEPPYRVMYGYLESAVSKVD